MDYKNLTQKFIDNEITAEDLIEEVVKLHDENVVMRDKIIAHDSLLNDIEYSNKHREGVLLIKIESLQEALKFYADSDKYEDDTSTTYGNTAAIVFDEGETAKKALGIK